MGSNFARRSDLIGDDTAFRRFFANFVEIALRRFRTWIPEFDTSLRYADFGGVVATKLFIRPTPLMRRRVARYLTRLIFANLASFATDSIATNVLPTIDAALAIFAHLPTIATTHRHRRVVITTRLFFATREYTPIRFVAIFAGKTTNTLAKRNAVAT